MEETTQVSKTSSTSYMSESIANIAAALSAFQGEIAQPKLTKEVRVKTKMGGTYEFKYADLGECMKAAAPGLKANGLAVTQIIEGGFLITTLTHKSGEWIRSTLALGVEKIDGFQSLGSAITYLKRYSYCAILGIVADADDDANLADGNTADIKDRRRTGAVAFTGEQLNQAIAEINASKTEQEYKQIWDKWAHSVPALCQNGTDFYKVAVNKMQELRTSRQ